MRKRILGILLTLCIPLCILLCLMPTAVFADGTPTGTPLTQENISNYKQEKNSTYSENGVYLPAGSYYLAEDIYLVGDDADPNSAWPLIIFEDDVTLDLNGHVLDLKKQNICIYSNVNLTLTDSNQNAEHKFRVEDSGLWVLDETRGTETVTGGVITGGTGVDSTGVIGIIGGGVNVSGGSFTMEGGSIVGCTANNGGGVRVSNGSFTMNGGRIAGCTAVKEGSNYGSGGGVRVDENSSFTMAGGRIEGCTAADAGGGVHVAYGSFTMEGGSIVGCTANTGGGVDAGGDSFTMKSGASISGCTALEVGGGVNLGNNSFTMEGGSITNCTANNGGGIYVQGNSTCELTMAGGSIEGCTADYAGGGVFVCSYSGSQRGSFTMNGGSITSCTAGGTPNAVHADGTFTDKTGTIDRKHVSGINGGHTGSETDPILIGSAEGLKNFRDKVNNGQTGLCATLVCDIVLNDGTFDKNGSWSDGENPDEWTPIGGYYGPGKASYTGTFDGGGHTIKGLYINSAQFDIGLFGQTEDATIKNLTVTGYVKGGSSVGGIVGSIYNDSSITIQNCVNYSTVTGDGGGVGGVGGIVGSVYNQSSITIRNCVNYSTVTGDGSGVGGIVGDINGSSTIQNCINLGNVTGERSVGGLVGSFYQGSIQNCANLGGVKGSENYTGGIVGYVTNSTTMTACYNVGKVKVEVEGTRSVGGLVGYAGYSDDTSMLTASNCYYLNTAAGEAFGNVEHFKGDTSGWRKTESEFADGTVLNLLKQNDTTGAWGECGYLAAAGMTLPLLSWQTADAHTCTPEDASQWESDESGHWQVCSCGLSVNKAAHSGTDDGNCTTDVSCDKCGYVIKLAQTEHAWTASWTAVRPGTTHEKACTNSGCGVTKTESCTGGTATCTEQATCEVCGEKYGTMNPDNHTGTESWITTTTHHEKKWSCCNAVSVANEPHEWTGGSCSECGYVCTHTGGTATCTDKATCSTCGEKYGDLDPNNHSGAKEWTIQNETEHEQKYSCCGTVTIAKEAHEWTNGSCSECGYVCTHTGGTATCTDKATCSTCGVKYGDLDPNNHSGAKEWTLKSETEHEQKYSCCGTVTIAKEAHEWTNGSCSECGYVCTHTGGTATCTEKATCSTCGEKYGDLDSNNHSGAKEWTIQNETEHEQKYSCCGKVTVAKEAHHWENGTCSECGYGCTHTGGTATCTERATCDTCGEKYGSVNPDNHTGTENWIISLTHHEEEWSCCGATTVFNAPHEWVNGVCYACGYECPHTGGTATCTDKATCSTCGVKYGDLDPNNHSGAKEWTIQDETEHEQKYSCCGTVTIAKEAHEWTNGTCSECGYGCAHTGGTATCTDKATCSTCGVKYGDLDPNNHSGAKEWTVKSETEHEQTYACCGKVTVAKEAHHWANGTCSDCGYKCAHTGGNATCAEKATCSICGEKYGELAEHSYQTEWSSDETSHFHKCSACDEKKDNTVHTLVWIIDQESSATETGAKHEECSVCGYRGPSQIIEKLAPNIIEGNNSNWAKGSKNGLTFRSNAAPADFVTVLVDGEILASDYYEKREDSLTTELKPDYLETLSEGKHTLTIRSASGDASTEFTIEAKSVSVLWIILPSTIVACGGAGAAVYVIFKKKRH